MKQSPSSIEAERGLLCSFFLLPDSVGPIVAERRITPDHFHFQAHGAIFRAVTALWAEGKGVDFITVSEWLREAGQLDQSGGTVFVMEVSSYIPTAANVQTYLDEVIAMHKLRQVIAAAEQAVKDGYEATQEPDAVIGTLCDRVMSLSTGPDEAEPDIKQLILDVTQDLDEAFRTKGKPADCVSTGFTELDGFLNGGIRASDTIVISAPTKGGKSIMADNILEHIAVNEKRPVVLFSLEMPAKERVKRIIASNGHVSLTAMIRGWLTTDTVRRIDAARTRLNDSRIIIRSRMVELNQIMGAIHQFKVRHPDLALVVVDYLQLVEAEQRKGDSRELVVGTISRRLRTMATTLGTPFIIVAQENDDGRARESRRIEMDCTTYLRLRDGKRDGTKDVEVSLNRNGPNGVFTLTHIKDQLRFENFAEEAP